MSSTAMGAARDSGAPPRSPRQQRGGLARAQRARNRNAFFLIIPSIVLLAVVIGYPIVSAIVMAFQKDAGLDAATGFFVQGGFAGISNFTHWLLQQCPTSDGGTTSCPPGNLGAQFWSSTFTTFFFTVVTVICETVFGFWMAIIMNRAFHGRSLVRTAILVPWAIPTAVTAKLWFFIFSVAGIVNSLFATKILWTSDDWPARIAIIIIDVWKTTPFMALLILAGLQLIPEEVYEAARVDGATTWKSFWTITLPLVRPALLVAVLFRILDALRMYDLPAIFGGGDATATWSVLVVQQMRQGPNAASALSTIVFVFIFLVAFLFVRFLGANVVQTTQAQQKGELK
ncbi:carbohydrate ABC transporter permease [Gryllotalpicola ginsengisoli]|uniref:carbohydrate ABC transporter permease n=1 Tax=Gryllotalpicola ginsengisoli TaxID=444608 RepID=UPI0003B4B247|nr:sugar ABC transporter permease [Gryllotalpicola ginsengisoli]